MATVIRYEWEDNGLEDVVEITQETAIAIAPKYNYVTSGELVLFGYNVYAILDENTVLLETYNTEEEAKFIWNDIYWKLQAGESVIMV